MIDIDIDIECVFQFCPNMPQPNIYYIYYTIINETKDSYINIYNIELSSQANLLDRKKHVI